MASLSPTPSLLAPSTSSAVSLVIANLVPLVGVVFLDWSLFGIMWIYWAESAVIGVFAILRMLTAGRDGWVAALLRLPMAGFFVAHYGFFWLIHGVFVYALFGEGRRFLLDGATIPEVLHGVPVEGLVPLVLSHGLSFVMNYLLGGERLVAESAVEMGKPYGRVIVLHVVIIVGGVLLMSLGATVGFLILFIALKTAVDLGVHLKGHRMRIAKARRQGVPEAA
ncbi:MAG: DUF6498-containing protein [Bacteroidota bacterium]